MQDDDTRLNAAAIQSLLSAPDEESRVAGIFFQALKTWRAGQFDSAFACLMSARATLGYVPLPIMANIVWLGQKLNRSQEVANECLAFGTYAIEQDYPDLGLEACAAALILDAMAGFEIIRSPARCLAVARLYEQVAAKLSIVPAVPHARSKNAPLTLALVVPNLVDHVVAYTKTVLHYARYADSNRFQVRVYSTENLAERDDMLFPFRCEQYRSETTGRATIAELTARGVPVFIASRAKRFTNSASDISAQLAADNVDLALFQTGLACPIDWLVARMAPVPVKAAIHIGVSLFNSGLNLTFFDNPENLDREAGIGSEYAGDKVVAPIGIDDEEMEAQQPLQRESFGIPPDAIIIGTLSNHLDLRLTGSYLTAIAHVLAARPNAWFMALGADTLDDKLEFFRARGLAARVCFGGQQRATGAALKMLDIYANEFPVGGSQSVMEAMACGLPVAALKWSDAHAESAGARAVGEPFAISGRDPEAYIRLILRWVDDGDERARTGNAMRVRAAAFSARTCVRNVLDRLERLFYTRH